MEIKYRDGQISFRPWELFEQCSLDDKKHLIDVLSCDAEIIKHVTEQILDGFTGEVSYGSRACNATPNPGTGLDWACREVAKRSGEVAAKEIKSLADALAREKSAHNGTYQLLQNLRNKYEH